MIDPELLKQSIKPGTSQCLIDWVRFVNSYHNTNRSPESIIAKWKGTELGECIDFDKLAELMKPKPVEPPKPEPVKPEPYRPIFTIKEERSVVVKFNDEQIVELFNLLDKNKEEHPELHEHVYQAMTRTLFSRI